MLISDSAVMESGAAILLRVAFKRQLQVARCESKSCKKHPTTKAAAPTLVVAPLLSFSRTTRISCFAVYYWDIRLTAFQRTTRTVSALLMKADSIGVSHHASATRLFACVA